MSTYFKTNTEMIAWPPVFERVFLKKQFTILEDGSCLAEDDITDEEKQVLVDAGAEIIGSVEDAHRWIAGHQELFPVVEDI